MPLMRKAPKSLQEQWARDKARNDLMQRLYDAELSVQKAKCYHIHAMDTYGANSRQASGEQRKVAQAQRHYADIERQIRRLPR